MTERTPVLDLLWQTVSENGPATVVIGATLVLTVFLGIAASPSQIMNSMITGGMWALMAMGLALVFGVMNIPYFAHGESFMVGAYVSYFVFSPISNYLQNNPIPILSAVAPFIGMLAASLAGFVMGVFLERATFYPLRLRSKSGEWIMNAFLLTLGITFVLTNGSTLVLGPNFRGVPRYWDREPVAVLGVWVSFDRIMAFVVAMVAIGILWAFLQRTRTGRAIRATAQDEVGAQMMGVNLDFVFPLTLGLSTALAALAGASLLFLFQAYPTVGLTPLYMSWYVVILVGLGNVAGAILGGFIVAVLQTATQHFVGIAWGNVVPIVGMILVLILVPSGIFGSEIKGLHEQ